MTNYLEGPLLRRRAAGSKHDWALFNSLEKIFRELRTRELRAPGSGFDLRHTYALDAHHDSSFHSIVLTCRS